MAEDKKVMQVGLFSTDAEEIKTLAKRVAQFNHRRSSSIVLDVEWHDKGDAQCEVPHAKIRLTFPNYQVQDAFWIE